MPFKKTKNVFQNQKNEGVVKSIFIEYSILLFHLVLLAVLGLLVLFFSGVVNYLTWIFLGGAAIIIASGYYFIRKLRKEQKTIREILMLPEFAGKDIEIRLLGGAASFKMGSSDSHKTEQTNNAPPYLQLETTAKSRIENLGELSRLYENKMISKEEYNILKNELLSDTVPGAQNDFYDIESQDEGKKDTLIQDKNGKKND
jgi:hypothetical protein